MFDTRCFRLVPVGLALLLSLSMASAGTVSVFAAASLKDVLEEIAPELEASTGSELVLTLAGSATLARQIARGAPADIFISANLAWMNELGDLGRIDTQRQIILLGNRLVVIGPATAEGPDTTGTVSEALAEGRIATAFVDAVPAGIYAREALQKLDLWDTVEARVVQGDSVRAALAMVAIGALPRGIVYATDAAAEPRVRVLATFPEGTHAPIIYPMAPVKEHWTPEVAAVLEYLTGPKAGGVFEKHGFTLPGSTP